jgi:hypothetical protein
MTTSSAKEVAMVTTVLTNILLGSLCLTNLVLASWGIQGLVEDIREAKNKKSDKDY